MNVRRLSVLLIGRASTEEFKDVANWLRERTTFACAEDMTAAQKFLADRNKPIDLMVIAQSRPAQFSRKQIQSLQSSAPLARTLALLGSWCEGEARTGEPWPGVARVYWHQWLARGAVELENIAAGRPSVWSLPHTATDGERFLTASRYAKHRQTGLIAIRARHAETAEALADAMQSEGYSTVCLDSLKPTSAHGVSALLWDCDRFDEVEAQAMQELATSLADVPTLAIVGYPRAMDFDLVQKMGMAGILSKPFRIQDLFRQLAQMVDAPSNHQTKLPAA